MEQYLKNKIAFVRGLSKTVGKYIHNVASLRYEIFKHKEMGWVDEYLIIEFVGGSHLVRNCSGVSETGILREIAKLCVGGYYDENKYYDQHIKDENWELLK